MYVQHVDLDVFLNFKDVNFKSSFLLHVGICIHTFITTWILYKVSVLRFEEQSY